MLRHKLLMRIGLLVLGFVGGAIISIALLETLLRDAERVADDSVQRASSLDSLHAVNAQLVATLPHDTDPAAATARESFDRAMTDLGKLDWESSPVAGAYAALQEAVDAAPDRHASTFQAEISLLIDDLQTTARDHTEDARMHLSHRLRLLIIGLILGALVMANLSVIVLLRTGGMILRPINALVEGSRLLAKEAFDHRVEVKGPKEFSELAHAYNELASRLQSNEQRKMEVLQQLGVTLNHELNNVMEIIELQLGLLDRRTGYDRKLGVHLKQIRSNLERMTNTVASLKDVRRIVVTQYPGGRTMLDLPRCTVECDVDVNPANTSTNETTRA